MKFDFENQKIIDVDIEREVKKSFMEYAVSVIISMSRSKVNRSRFMPFHLALHPSAE